MIIHHIFWVLEWYEYVRKANIVKTLTMKVTDYIQYGANFFFKIPGTSLSAKPISDLFCLPNKVAEVVAHLTCVFVKCCV
jgi:hypothetical protein